MGIVGAIKIAVFCSHKFNVTANSVILPGSWD